MPLISTTADRPLTLSSPAIPEIVGRPALVLLKLSGREAVNELFEYLIRCIA